MTTTALRTFGRGLTSAAAGARWRVCIVGSGPSGFYCAESLLKGNADVEVDVIDRLPVPFGLVRFGVAPDHPEVKNVTERFTGIARTGRVRYFGNVVVADGTGSTVSVEELRQRYSAVVLACGADADRTLGAPGENLTGVHSAREFVAWYNSHPNHATEPWDLTRHDTAVVIGQGNVALDVARVLVKSPSELAVTDISPVAVAVLERSTVKRVFVVGRRGPLQAAFTIKVLRELTQISGCALKILAGAPDAFSDEAMAAVKDNRPRKRQAELLRKLAAEAEGRDELRGGSEVVLCFHRSPVAFEPAHWNTGALGAVCFEKTVVEDGKAVGTGEFERIPCGYAFRSIGYRASPLPGVPFDERRSLVPSRGGRVLEASIPDAPPLPGVYATGWYKRGPTGVILTNIGDAADTARAVLADRAAGAIPSREIGVDDLIAARGIRTVDFNAWERIDQRERADGGTLGKRLKKVDSVPDMLRIALGEGQPA